MQRNAERHLKSPKEMERLFRSYPEAVLRTATVAGTLRADPGSLSLDGLTGRVDGAAVAGNIANVSGELAKEWDDPAGVQKSWKNPGKNSDDFADSKEAVTALLGILVHGAETVRDQRLENFYKGKHDTARPKMAIYWRSRKAPSRSTSSRAPRCRTSTRSAT